MMIWLVSEKRFLQEYHNHIRNTPLKFVNWFVDTENNVAKMYITATNGTDVFCYIHKELPIPDDTMHCERLSNTGLTCYPHSDDRKGSKYSVCGWTPIIEDTKPATQMSYSNTKLIDCNSVGCTPRT